MSAETTSIQTHTESGMTLQNILQELNTSVTVLAQQSRDLQRNLKRLMTALEKEQKRSAKVQHKPAKRTVNQKPDRVSKEMETFITSQGIAHSDEGYTRNTMMRVVSKYIHDHGLQLEDNKKNWKADETLRKLLNLDSSLTYSFMNVNGLLSRVIQK
jgi:chromatin remodeling complex protein RSC6